MTRRYGRRVAIMVATLACLTTMFAPAADAATLTALTLTPSNPTKSVSTTYTIAMSSASGSALCIRVHFGTSVAFGGLPAGMSFATPGAAVITGNGSLAYTTTTSGDYVQGTDATGVTPTSLAITNVTNYSSAATVYAEVDTFSNVGCTTPLDSGLLAFAVTDNTIVSVTVDPSFTFSVANKAAACNGETNFVTGAGTATAVALGHLAVSSSASGAQTLTVSGNSGGGYAVYARSTNATTNLRSAGHNWADVVGTYASPAAFGAGERFGYTYHDNEASGTIAAGPASGDFAFLDNTNHAIMDGGSAVSAGTGCIGFQAQTGASTQAGVYTATVIYVAVPVF